MQSYIQENITRTYLTYTFKCDTPYDMLVALRHRVAPTNQACEVELVNYYQKLKRPPRNQNIDLWLQHWEKTYMDCKDLDIPDIKVDRPLHDFLNAVSMIAPDFAGYWTNK